MSKKGRVWLVVEIKDYKRHKRPQSQGGLWYVAQRMRVEGLLYSTGYVWASTLTGKQPYKRNKE